MSLSRRIIAIAVVTLAGVALTGLKYMENIRNSQGPMIQCRYWRIVVLAGVVIAGFYCINFLMIFAVKITDQVGS